ncbi:MAG TPA: tRNA (adenosine(37)-N6)-dimethylallyltransferase MiaA [Candidatus Saccharimonadales bacterium]|nr:tRNA (adenosine(37)-N6)-dimethylallyltransferase MiaA [Candidatus Saccharimonadales bacterium]
MPPLVVIVGETASGKSALAMELAEKFGGELICADSWTVYKGFDIGTAKPTAAERERVPHHMLDVADPAEGFNAVKFQRLAKQAIADITARGKLPILVGGTGLYIDTILYDYGFLPPTDPTLRAKLNTMELPDLLSRAETMGLDLGGIDLRNKRRVIRLIENNGIRPTKQAMRANTLIIGVRRPLEELRQRIVQRIDMMVEHGFADEVKRLGEQYGWDCEPMRAPGYRAFADYVQGRVTLAAAKERFMLNDLQLAKKQRTWFKRNDSIQWLSDRSKAVDLVTTFLNKTN